MSKPNDLELYRQKNKRRFELMNILKNKLEFDDLKRNVYRIKSFIKKYILFTPCNISDDEIRNIPGIYRFRCYVYDFELEISMIDELYENELNIIMTSSDQELRNALIFDLNESISSQKKQLYDTINENTLKYPIMLDLRNFINSDLKNISIHFNNQTFLLDDKTTERLNKQIAKVSQSEHQFERFQQLLNYSKVMCESYVGDNGKFAMSTHR